MMKYFLVMFYGFVVGYDLLLGVIRLTEGNPWGWLFLGLGVLFIVVGSWVIWLRRNEDELKLYLSQHSGFMAGVDFVTEKDSAKAEAMIEEQYDAAYEAYAKASKLFPWSKS